MGTDLGITQWAFYLNRIELPVRPNIFTNPKPDGCSAGGMLNCSQASEAIIGGRNEKNRKMRHAN